MLTTKRPPGRRFFAPLRASTTSRDEKRILLSIVSTIHYAAVLCCVPLRLLVMGWMSDALWWRCGHSADSQCACAPPSTLLSRISLSHMYFLEVISICSSICVAIVIVASCFRVSRGTGLGPEALGPEHRVRGMDRTCLISITVTSRHVAILVPCRLH